MSQRVRLRCERTQVRITPQTVLFITVATAIYSLGHGLRTSTPASAVPRSTQPCISPRSPNRVPASGGVKAGNVTSAGWQATLCDPVRRASFRSGEDGLHTAIPVAVLIRHSCSALGALTIMRHTNPRIHSLTQSLTGP